MGRDMRFSCDWIFNILVVLCDGKVVCGCADPTGARPLGNLAKNSLLEIWNSERVREIRRGLNEGFSFFCLDCGLKKTVAVDEPLPQRPQMLETLPRIFVEPTVLCNLDCYGSVCSKQSGIIKTRDRNMMPLDEFRRLLEPVGSGLIRLDLFNYGDPFAHPQAVEMIRHLKRAFPRVYLYTSTNGLLLDEEKIRGIVQAGLDEITFSIDGADQASYSRYRRGGDFAKALEIMGQMVRERNRSGREIPFINWRYILFHWNDSRSMMNRARQLAKTIGVDRLNWEITDHPADAYSRKYQPGSRPWKKIYHEIWDSSQIGSAIPGKRFSAVIKPPAGAIRGSCGRPTSVEVKVKNTGGALWLDRSYSGRRLVRLGAQLFSSDRRLLDLNYGRAFMPRSMALGDEAKIELALPTLGDQGDYWLKFDMVSEGVDWFEAGGSPVVWRRFLLR